MKVVIFDMDGTLLDSKKDITLSINHTRYANYALPPLGEDEVVKAINMSKRNLAQIFYGTLEYTHKDKEVFESHYYEQCIKHTYLYDGVYDMLETLYHNNVKLAVATNAYTKFAKKMLSHLAIDEFFGYIIGADKSESKPSPKMLNLALDHFGFDKKLHKAWMVGDSIKDVQSAAQAKIKHIFVTWGFADIMDTQINISNPKEVLDIVL